MNPKFTHLLMMSLCLSSFAGAAQADNYYSTQTPSGGYVSNNPGYYSSGSTSSQEHHKEHKKERNKLSIALNLPIQRETIVVTERGPHHHYREPQWIGMRTGAPLPRDVVVGGGQSMPPATLFVCRANYHGGMHPGKLLNGQCNIGWGGSEIVMNHYEVLVTRTPLSWVPASFGSIPPGALQGGYHQSGPLFICQADYNGGTHIGKVVGQNCNFGWGGKEVLVPYYNVLVG